MQHDGWVIEGQRSKPLSKEKWKELSEFRFDDLPDNDESSAISAMNLNTEFELKT